MSNLAFRLGLVILGLGAEIGTGIWVRSGGRPFPVLPFTIHKLLTVGLLIGLVVLTVQAQRANGLSTTCWLVLIGAVLSLLASTVSGGWIAASPAHPPFLIALHKWAPCLAAPATAVAFFLLFRQSVSAGA